VKLPMTFIVSTNQRGSQPSALAAGPCTETQMDGRIYLGGV
jgi:hypothetical protein